MDRRTFLQTAAGAAAATGLRAQQPLETEAPLRRPNYQQVSVEDVRLLAQQANALAILQSFDADALMKPFREMGGLPAPDRDLGGWYKYVENFNWHGGDAGLAPGHSFGQWTSAMARFSAARADGQLADRVAQFHAALNGSITPGFFDKNRYPSYVVDKLNCGLMDAHALLGDPDAFAVLEKVRECATPSLPGRALEREVPWRKNRDFSFSWDESYTIAENLYLLYSMGAGQRYRDLARQYLFTDFFASLARNRNVLGGVHGYSHVNMLSSAMQAWFVDGSREHLDAARNGFDMVAAQSFATGGWAPDELFDKPGGTKLFDSLHKTHAGFETPCGTYAQAKLCRYLLQATRDGKYGDSMERVMWNAMLGALPMQPDGHAFYYQDMNASARRTYFAQKWPCCSGSYPQVAADYGINSFLLGPTGDPSVWLNLYFASTLRWRHHGTRLAVHVEDGYPQEERVRLRLAASSPTRFTLHLRVPGWCDRPRLRVNGKPHPLVLGKGFAAVTRRWTDGDRVELELPARLRLLPFPANGGAPHPELAALCWGPWVLMALSPMPQLKAEQLLSAERIGPMEWLARRSGSDLYLRPFVAIGGETYSAYVQLT